MSNILTHSMPAEEIACWIMEIEREYPTLPRGERRIARRQLRQLRDELGIRDELDRIETEQPYFARSKPTPGRLCRMGSNCCSEAKREGVHKTRFRSA
jgi:hypothetical protein